MHAHLYTPSLYSTSALVGSVILKLANEPVSNIIMTL